MNDCLCLMDVCLHILVKKFQKVLKICALAILFTMKSVKNIL